MPKRSFKTALAIWLIEKPPFLKKPFFLLYGVSAYTFFARRQLLTQNELWSLQKAPLKT
jgi:hypothetical protein